MIDQPLKGIYSLSWFYLPWFRCVALRYGIESIKTLSRAEPLQLTRMHLLVILSWRHVYPAYRIDMIRRVALLPVQYVSATTPRITSRFTLDEYTQDISGRIDANQLNLTTWIYN